MRRAVELPKSRMRDPLAADPCPIRRAPPSPIAVAAGVDELHELVIGHVVDIDAESADPLHVRWRFVVPCERRGRIGPQRGVAGGDAHAAGAEPPATVRYRSVS